MNRVPSHILKRTYFLMGLFLLFGLVISGRIIYVQTIERDEWLAEQKAHRVYRKKVPALRGSILADDGAILATTLPFFRIGLDATVLDDKNFPSFNDSLDILCKQLANAFPNEGISADEFRRKILTARQQQDRHIYLFSHKRLFNWHEMKLIRSMPIFNRGQYEGGLILEKVHNRRFYPMDNLCLSTLGRLDPKGEGARGIEYSFNAALAGISGEMLVQRITPTVEIPLNYGDEKEAKDGYDVHSTINVHIQDITASALRKAVEKHQAKEGIAILMEVKTGNIKAIANYPEIYNTAFATQLEPGSTFKIASAIAAIEDGVVSPDDTIDTGKGSRHFYDRKMMDENGYGKITFRQVIEKSSNIGVADVINTRYKNTPSEFIKRLESTGILDFTQFQLKGEPQPYIIRPGNKHWNGTTLPWLSTGYNVKLTPLQVLTFYNAIANGGKMMKPLLVNRISKNTDVRETFKPTVLRERICSPRTLAIVQQMLEGVVERGTAKSLRGGHYKIAGKTGTAQILTDGAYQKKYRSSFAGYFPADNPIYSCIVVITDPEGGAYYGADVAAPVFKEIADNIYATMLESNYKEPPALASAKKDFPISPVVHVQDAKTLYNKLNISTPETPGTPFARARRDGETVALTAYKVKSLHMPNVKGMSAKDALSLLENLGLNVSLVGSGRVQAQSIPTNSRLKHGQNVILTLG